MGCGGSKPKTPAEGALLRLIARVQADENWQSKSTFPDFGKRFGSVAEKLVTLNIAGCNLGPVAGATVGAALPSMIVLEELVLTACGLDNIGTQAVARAIGKREQATLKLLWLGSNYAEALKAPDTTEAICESLDSQAMQNLTSLNLNDNGLGARGSIRLAECLAKLVAPLAELQLADSQLGSSGGKALVAAAGNILTLRRVDLFNDSISDGGAEGAAKLLSSVPLISLSLQGNAITHRGLVEIASGMRDGGHFASSLEMLDLSSNAMGNESDEGLKLLASAITATPPQKLSVLNLAENCVGFGDPNALLIALGLAPALRWLDLSSNALRSDACMALAGAIGTMAALETLGLNDNDGIGDEAMGKLFEALFGVPTLSEMHACKVSLKELGGNAAARLLSKDGSSLMLLDLRSNGDLSDDVRNELRKAADASPKKPTLTLPNAEDVYDATPGALNARKFNYEHHGSKKFVKDS